MPQKVNSLQAYSSALLKPAQEYQQEIKRQQDIKINSNLMQAQVDADEFMREHQLKFQATPNSPEAQAELKSGLQDIYNRYGQNIDPMFRQNWQIASNKSQSAYQIVNNRWVAQQREKNAQIDMANSMNVGFQRAYSLGRDGNLDQAVADLTQSYNSIKANLINEIGEVNAEELTKDYKKKFAMSYVDGLMQTNPEMALQTINDKSYQNLFDDPRDLDRMKEYGLAKLDNVKKTITASRIYADISTGTGLLNKSMERNLSIEEIDRMMPSNASNDYNNLILHLNGYRTKGKSNVSAQDKAIAEMEVYDNFASLMANENTTPEDWMNFTNSIYAKMANGSLSTSKGMKMLNEFAVPISKKEESILETKGSLWWKKETGFENLKNIIPQETVSGDKQQKKAIKARNAKALNYASELYFSSLKERVAQSDKFENLNQLFSAEGVDKDEIIKKATEDALIGLNQNRFERLKSIPREKQPNAILNKGALINNSNNVENSKQGTPVKSGALIVGKYSVEVE